MTLKGEVLFQGKARIDGTITGNVDGEHLILSETGKIVGDINVSSFNCYGSLEGNAKATILIARKNCFIQGKLEAENLTVEPGACIQGEIQAASQDVKAGEKNDSVAATPTTSSDK
jgi:cytoskeletal protein CcmA (bactofilin family)